VSRLPQHVCVCVWPPVHSADERNDAVRCTRRQLGARLREAVGLLHERGVVEEEGVDDVGVRAIRDTEERIN